MVTAGTGLTPKIDLERLQHVIVPGGFFAFATEANFGRAVLVTRLRAILRNRAKWRTAVGA